MSFPKRLRYFLVRDADLLNRVLRIFLDSVEKGLHSCCPDVQEHARLGAVTFVHYCARPIFAGERLQWIEKNQQLIYRLPKPSPNGQTSLTLTPVEFLDKLAVLVPPPRKYRHRYHGVLAPNAPLRQTVTAYAGLLWGD